jgi:hypothetical protein
MNLLPNNSRRPDLTDLERAEQLQIQLSANSYGHRPEWRKDVGRSDWWIAIGIYAVLCSIAFVMF